MRVALAEARKDLLLLLANRGELISLLLVPLIIVTFLGYAEQALIIPASAYSLPVIDLDRSPQSRQLVDALRSDRSLRVSVAQPTSSGAVDPAGALREAGAAAVLVIPAGSGARMAGGQPVQLRAYTDPSQAERTALVMLSLRRTAARVAAPQAAIQIVAQAAAVPLASAEPSRDVVSAELARPTLTVGVRPASGGRSLPGGFDEAVPGISLMWTIAFFSRGALLADDERRTSRTAARNASTAASRSARLLGRVLSGYLIVGAQIAVLFLVGALVFRIDVGSIAALAVVLAAFVAVPAAGSALLGTLGLDGQLLELMAFVGMFVIGAFSGAFVPLYLLPSWLAAVAVVSPLYWAISAVQDVMIRGAALSDIVQPTAALLALAATCIALAVLAVRSPRRESS